MQLINQIGHYLGRNLPKAASTVADMLYALEKQPEPSTPKEVEITEDDNTGE